MKFSNELKVGAVLVIAALILIIGIRYFQDIPLFSGTYELHTVFENAEGLVTGNPVRINGVNVGRVEQIKLSDDAKRVFVRFHLDKGIEIPQGSTSKISGAALLGSVRLDIRMGLAGNTPYMPNDTIPSLQESGVDQLLDKAPDLMNKADSLLLVANSALGGADALLTGPNSELIQTLAAFQRTADAMSRLLQTEQVRLGRVLEGTATLTDNLSSVALEQNDSLRVVTQNLNRVINRLDRNMATLEATTASLDAVVRKIDQGEGSLGLLINDPGLYLRLDSTLTSLNTLLVSFEKDPKRFLKDLKLVDVF